MVARLQILALIIVALVAGTGLAAAEEITLESVIQSGGEDHANSLVQDTAQQMCTQYDNQIPANLIDGFLEEQKALIRYPDSGELFGDWEKGDQWFSDSGAGNCYACHEGDPDELAAGNVGPPLTDYGQRGRTEATVRWTYDQIYNAWAHNPCSTMYRAGVHGRLSPEQVADIVAFLFASESPINPNVTP